MSIDKRTAEVGPWAKEKLDALHRYLNFYTTVLKNQPWCKTIYIDAFAGGGRAVLRGRDRDEETGVFWEEATPEQIEFVNGSPRIALEIANPFARYVFNDANAARVAELEALKKEYGDTRQIDVRHGSAAEQINWVLSQNLGSKHRGVAFLDPFGAHLEWSSIEALARTRIFEVLINFPLQMAINRLLKLDGDIPPSWRAQLDGFFGGSEWFELAYVKDSGLFQGIIDKRHDSADRLLRFYLQRLKSAFGHVSEPKLIINTRGVGLYYLIWAGPHLTGLRGANYILKMGKPSSIKRV